MWDTLSGRTHDHSWDAPGHHVEGRVRFARWWQLWRRNRHRQRHRLSIIIAAAVFTLASIVTSCDHSSHAVVSKSQPPSLDAVYRDANTKSDTGELPAAIALTEEGIRRTRQNDIVWNWKFRVLEAEIRLWQRRSEEALNLVKPGVPVALASGEFDFRATLTQARAYNLLNDPENAEAFLAKAKKLVSAVPEFTGDLALAEATLLYGKQAPTVQQQRILIGRQEKKLQEALNLARQYNNKLLEAKVLGSQGHLYTQHNQFDAALGPLQASLDISNSLHAGHIAAATELNLGWSYLEKGDIDGSERFFEDALKFSRQAEMNLIEDPTLNNLGRVNLAQTDYPAARNYYELALKMAEQLKENENAANVSNNLALVALKTGQLDEAERYIQQAERFLSIYKKKSKNSILPDEFSYRLTQGSIANARGQFPTAEKMVNSVIQNAMTPGPVRAEARGELANIYAASKQISNAERQYRAALRAFDAVRNSMKDKENRLAFSGREVDFYTDYIRFLIDQNRQPEALGIAEFMRARTLEEGLNPGRKARPEAVPIQAVQAFLKKKKQAIFTYWLAPKTSYLWVITPTAFQCFSLPDKHEIEQKIEQYRKGVITTSTGPDIEELGRSLFNMLVQPARQLLTGDMTLIIIPDGKLGRMNFEALIEPDPQVRYWIEDVEVVNASSIQLAIRSKAGPLRGDERMLAMGNAMAVPNLFPELQNAHDELYKAAKNFPPAQRTIIEREKATASAYKMSTPGQFGVMHFATHGSISLTRPLDSALILSPDPDHNYRLYARDILKFPLHAELVTFSACSGAGARTYNAEGLVGLAWAFIGAGAHQVIAGLWDVDDYVIPKPDNDLVCACADKRPSQANQ